MNELGKFRNKEDTFRSDPYDGSRPFRVTDEAITVTLEAQGMSPPSISWPLPSQSIISHSFVGVEKIPIFSATQLDESVFIEIEPRRYKFNVSFVDHMAQFGQYAVLLNKSELIEKLETYANEQHVKVHCGRIRYVSEKTPPPELKTWEEQIEEFVFVKTISEKDERNYHLQNEWRCAITYPQIISSSECHVTIDVGKFEYAVRFDTLDWLKEGILTLEHHAE